MKETKLLLEKIIEGIQSKKGTKIAVMDLTLIQDCICDYFIICQASSTTQVNAIAHNVVDHVKSKIGEKPIASKGGKNMEWMAIDHGNIMTHIFLPETREYYKLEQLWSDAHLTYIEDIQ